MITTVATAKSSIIPLIKEDLARVGKEDLLSEPSPDPKDPGKFVLNHQVGRVIHKRDGFYVKINLEWFIGKASQPEVHEVPFYWYAFAVAPPRRPITYYICNFRQMMHFALDFNAPLGNDHRDHFMWNGRFTFSEEGTNEGHFTWGDEPLSFKKPDRLVRFRNVLTVI